MTRIALALLGLTVTLATPASAQPDANYPDRPVRLIVPFPAGSSTDIVSRMMAQKFSTRLGQQFVVENRAGASGNLGADMVAKAVPDGYTIGLITASTHGVAPALGTKLPYDTMNDFKPISMVGAAPYVLVLYPGIPAKSLAELVALAKTKPGQLNYGSAGLASLAHLAAALLPTTRTLSSHTFRTKVQLSLRSTS
jgi:tripartite-type tricarboxylate transporter receptor subunit TctC